MTNDAFRCRDLPAMLRSLVRPEAVNPSWWARTFELDGITEEQVRTAVDDEIIRRLKEADEDHGE